MLAVGLVVAVAGWVVGTRAEVISDLRELVPSDLPELQNVDELQEETGVSGEVEVAVRADDLTDPEVVAWMGDFKQRVLDDGRLRRRGRRLRRAGRPALSRTSPCPTCSATSRPGPATAVEGVLDLLPAYFSPPSSAATRGLDRGHHGDPVRDQGDAVRRAEGS